MPAYSEDFPWPSSRETFEFFEEQMLRHNKVQKLIRVDGGLYELTTQRGNTLKVFVCQCYAFGVAEYREVVDKLGEVNIIVIDSAWCGYSDEVKRHCRALEVGLFKVGQLMAALNREDTWSFLDKNEIERFERKGWL